MRAHLRPSHLVALAAVAFSVFLTSRAHAADVAVVVNPKTAVTSLTKDQIRDIFTGLLTRWDDGKKITFVILLDKGQVHETFMSQYVGKDPTQFQMYWKKMIFSGKGAEPKSGKSEKEVLEFVAKTEGAIGYVGTGAVSSTVKTVSVK